VDGVDIDLTYAISEIQDIQAELKTNHTRDTEIASRLEGVEARLKEVTEALIEYASFAASSPYAAASTLIERLG
jgi:hypothetical protein